MCACVQLHPYTFRNEDVYLADVYATDPLAEYDLFFRVVKLDGCFTDFTPSLVRYFEQVKDASPLAPLSFLYEPVLSAAPSVSVYEFLKFNEVFVYFDPSFFYT